MPLRLIVGLSIPNVGCGRPGTVAIKSLSDLFPHRETLNTLRHEATEASFLGENNAKHQSSMTTHIQNMSTAPDYIGGQNVSPFPEFEPKSP